MQESEKKKKLSPEELSNLLDSFDEKQTVRWYNRWGAQPWGYAFISVLKKLPFLVIFLFVFQFEKIKPMLKDPLAYIRERGIFYLICFFALVLVQRFVWKKQAFKYYLLWRQQPDLFPLDADGSIARAGEHRAERLPRLHGRWANKKIVLAILWGLSLPIFFFSILYIIGAVKDGNWSWAYFIDSIKETGLFIFGIFLLFGVGIGINYWKEVTEQYRLLYPSNFSGGR